MSTETKQPNYWKSLNELAQNEEYKKYVEREFPENASELTDDVSRRSFLKVMGASIALAGFAACRRPVQKILPYSKQPEDVDEGIPLHYATAMPRNGILNGLLVEANEGRPTKAEGNEEHPGSMGNTSIFGQASIINLYDPDRSRFVRQNGEIKDWNAFVTFCSEYFSNTSKNVAFLSEANSSPTLHRLKEEAIEKFSNTRWFTYEVFDEKPAFEGNRIAFGEPLRTVNHFDKADVILSLDDDFLNPAVNPNSVQDTGNYADSRRVLSTDDEMSRLYMVENTLSLTGSNADNRLRLKASEVEHFIYALAAELSTRLEGLEAFNDYSNSFSDHKWISVLSNDLLENRGSSIVTAGKQQNKHVHATVAAINSALGNTNSTVEYISLPFEAGQNSDSLSDLVDSINNGDIDSVVIIGGNPAFTAPTDLNFGEAIKKVDTSIHLSDYFDETSKLTTWHVNRTHFLEAWGDGYSYRGTRSIIQPLIRPLFDGKNELEFLAAVVRGKDQKAYDLVQSTWKKLYPSGFRNKWRKILHDGIDTNKPFTTKEVSLTSSFQSSFSEILQETSSIPEGMEIVFKPDNSLLDGRYANNGWLQEMPDPVTKITWDNVALMSKNTAEKLGINIEEHVSSDYSDLIAIEIGETKIEIAAWVLPGHADDSITLPVGYGRKDIGRVADDTGTNVYPLRSSTSKFIATDVSISNTGKRFPIATTQDHHAMEGRSLVRSATMDQYQKDPEFATYESVFGHPAPGIEEAKAEGKNEPISLFDPQKYPDYEPQWGMSIDLNTCTGCSACIVACVAENNIPVIGKREVRRGREMHWIRIDRYFEGDVEDPNIAHQPVPCMQCEMAPCEEVCPVAATTHSEDGMNQMTYNRCIGTRYCANNCPYKVRHFNFFNYSDEFLTNGKDPEVIQMAMNPEVTVRFRGVMEKCTYCVQRVNRAKINRKVETNGKSVKPEDGSVKTACQQACPTNAIDFGDLTDENSKVVKLKRNERNYTLLEQLNTRPRTTYLAALKNPHTELTRVSNNHNEHH